MLGLLTTLATSGPDPHVVEDSAETRLVDDDVLHATVRINRAAFDHGDDSWIYGHLEFVGIPAHLEDIQVRVVPDDSRLEVRTFTLLPVIAYGSNRASHYDFDLAEVCEQGQDCELGLSFEILESEGEVDISVRAVSKAYQDGGFCSTPAGHFPSDAEVEVSFDE